MSSTKCSMSTHDCAYIHFAFVHYAISIALVFGVVTCFSGVLGVACGALIAKRLRAFPKIGRTADPLVSAFGMFVAIPSMYLAFFIPTYSQSACFVSSIRNECLLRLYRTVSIAKSVNTVLFGWLQCIFFLWCLLFAAGDSRR